MEFRSQNWIEWLIGLAWIGAVSVGLVSFWRYEHTAGAPAYPPAQWPASTQLALAPEGLTLVLMAHPRCPCTRASLSELQNILEENPGRVTSTVLFYKPQEAPTEWAQTDVWESAAKLPGAQVILDEDNREAERFRVNTSGHAVMYDAAGQLLFSGGLTRARGQFGSNASSRHLAAMIQRQTTVNANAPVFGCPLFAPSAATPLEEVQTTCKQ